MVSTSQCANKTFYLVSYHAGIQSNIASKPATGMQVYTMTKNKNLTSLKAVELGVVGACMGFIEPIDNRTCFTRKSYLTEPVELCQ